MPSGEQRMKYTLDSERLWCRDDGSIKRPGDHWTNPDLADTLERLARSGAWDFYEGEIAARIAQELARGSGYVTADDLRNYRIRALDPIEGTFRGLTVRSAAPPASGITCVQMLQVLNNFPPLQPEDPRSYVLLASAMHEAFAARLRAVADPDFVNVPVAELTSDHWAEEAAVRIRQRTFTPTVAAGGGEGTTHVS